MINTVEDQLKTWSKYDSQIRDKKRCELTTLSHTTCTYSTLIKM